MILLVATNAGHEGFLLSFGYEDSGFGNWILFEGTEKNVVKNTITQITSHFPGLSASKFQNIFNFLYEYVSESSCGSQFADCLFLAHWMPSEFNYSFTSLGSEDF